MLSEESANIYFIVFDLTATMLVFTLLMRCLTHNVLFNIRYTDTLSPLIIAFVSGVFILYVC